MALRLLGICVGLAALAGGLAADGRASDLIDRNASNVKLDVNTKGEALLTYTVGGKIRRVLAWGAVDALAPTQSRKQVKFRLDYSGGYGIYRRKYWQGFRNSCGAYRGPALGWLVKACTAPDGSHWTLQSWQRALPNYGLGATPTQAVWELRLSHWRGEPAVLEVTLDWAYRRFDHLYGRLTYRGEAVHGFRSTSTGVPLDTFGRNLYVDTFNSTYGEGWKRENSFLAQRDAGTFCYGFFSHGARPSGKGERYRATVIGPGVTPDPLWESEAQGSYDLALDQIPNEEQRERYTGGNCRPN